MVLNEAHIITDVIEIYKGLAFEQVLYLYLLQEARSYEEPFSVMCIWKSKDSVVIGRNQNPLIESNFLYLLKNNIQLARRDSGGGTVYQDKNNINICVISNNKENLIQKNLESMVKVLSILGYHCTIDDKHNIRYEGDKISGSAFRYSKDVQMHHYTLLLQTNLTKLEKAIHPTHNLSIQHKGIDSNRTSVCNLGIDSKKIMDAFLEETNPKQVFYRDEKTIKTYNQTLFDQEYERLKSNKWIFGRSPSFNIDIIYKEEEFIVEITKFKIVSIYKKNKDQKKDCRWQGEIDISSYKLMEAEKKQITNIEIFDIIDDIQKKIWRKI